MTGPARLWSQMPPSERVATAFEQLFLAHYQEVYRHAYRILGNHQEAEDVAQEAFLRLHRQRFAPGREHNHRAWLYRVATNLAYNAVRGARRREQREVWSLEDEGLALVPEAEALRRAEQETVRQALADLPERQAQLLLLRHAGLSYQELAEALGVAPGSVGTLLARAHEAFVRAYRRLTTASQGGE